MKEERIVPTTLGIIMDGNGRWAVEHGDKRAQGHTAGIYNMVKLVCHAFDAGINNVVVYGLSTENLKRPQAEVEHIYKLMLDITDYFVKAFGEKQACVKYIGNFDLLPKDVVGSMHSAEEKLSKFSSCGKIMYVAVAYGARSEIITAVNNAVECGEPLTEESLLASLSFNLQPDLIIRTGGERRLSNFLLYQASYSELYFTDKYFPDFTEADLDAAVEWYSGRNRRFGKSADGNL